jgi:hypothetical protein
MATVQMKKVLLLEGPGHMKQVTVPAYFTTFAYPVGSGCSYREYVYSQSKEDPECFQYDGQTS